jgi:hypothetical protein
MGELNLDVLASFLGWLIIVNFIFILFRVFIFGGAPKNLIYKIHYTFFKVTHEDFAKAHYHGIILHVTLTVFFTLLPYLVIRILF